MAERDFSSPVQVCPVNRPCWDLSPEQIQEVSEHLISQMNAWFHALDSSIRDNNTASNALKVYADMQMEYFLLRNVFLLNQHVSDSEELRTVSTSAINKLCVEFGWLEGSILLDRDLSDILLTDGAKKAILDDMLSLPKGQEIKKIRDIVNTFKLHWIFPEWVLTELHDYNPTSEQMRNVKRQLDNALCLPKDNKDEYRKIIEQLLVLHQPLVEKNWPRLKKRVKLLARVSALLGCKTHADCVLKRNMANSAEKVSTFLDELAHKLKPLGDKERAILLKLKKEDRQKSRLSFDGMLYTWELRKYMPLVIKENYGVDHDQLKEYFPLEVVTQGLLDIFQDLLGLSFSLVDGASVWHPDVTLYCVTDQSSQQMVGQLYLDLFIRCGKRSRISRGACFPLQPGCLRSDGTRQIPIVAIATNFRKSKSTPCLLYHREVLTYFHEFGHAMHYLCARVDYAVFNSFMVEPDFEEAPALMFENWVWEKEPLQRISKHYKTGAPIPDDLLDKLIKSRLANIGMVCLRKIINAKVDQALHTRAGLDPGNEYARLTKKILGVPTNPIYRLSEIFGEPLDENPANHYRYLWSEVLAMDMFYSRFKQEGIMNPKVGLDYRECILKPGASKDAEEMLKNFLGREPNQKAFLQSKGITTLENRKRKIQQSQMKKRKRN